MKYPDVDQRILKQWQETTNLLAKLCDVPAALVMRQNANTMEVMSTSENGNSPYEAHETAPLHGELYCETVIKTQQALNIPNALIDPEWDQNPDIALGMISYYGVPINWPGNVTFGTLCVLDRVEKDLSEDKKNIVSQFAQIIEISLELLLSNQSHKSILHKHKVLHEQVSSLGKIGHWSLNYHDNELFWSPEIYKIHGVTSDEYTPELETAINFYHPDDISVINRHVDNALNNEAPWSFSLRIVRPDGEIRFVRSLAEISRDPKGVPTSVFGVFQDITEYKELNEQVELLSHVANASNAAVIICDKDKKIIWINEAFTSQSGYELDEVAGKYPGEFLQGKDTNLGTMNKIRNSLDQGNDLSVEILNYHKKGSEFWVNLLLSSVKNVDGEVTNFVGIQNDITEQKLSAEKLKLSASVFTHARESIIITDADGLIVDVNDTFSDITGYIREEVIGKNSRILQSARQSPEFYLDMWQDLLEKNHWSGELWNRRKNGEVYAEMKTISSVLDEHGNTSHYVSLGSDITPMKEYQIQLEHIANHDILTNLPNRSLLADRLTQAMVQCNRYNKSLAVVFLDLDGFKAVNDAHGHDVGDKLLIALSIRIKEALREGDSLARIGGDEFVAVLADLAKIEDCEPVLERLLLSTSDPISIGDVAFNLSASLGVTIYPQDSSDADILLRHADQAMYTAKALGKNRYHLFDTAQDEAVKVQREGLDAIRFALDNNQFVLYYQPKVNMKTGQVIGSEALIRWQHPERGLLSPSAFLPIIENNSMMIELGEWVIAEALAQISQWQVMGFELAASTSVNIAAIQLQQPDFTQRLMALLATHPEVEPRFLELEVLETSALDDISHVSEIMNECMRMGVKFALDDFGTGYSSLTYLRKLPSSLIKIDQSFVQDMLNDPDDLAIVEGVIALAKSFKRDVIAEGVETIEHGSGLLALGCEMAQGYGIARPMPASDVAVWISDWKPDSSWQA
jgi:diguanylate cyclase (GGDEF)-like protein/PAS domain S-box-containing protein